MERLTIHTSEGMLNDALVINARTVMFKAPDGRTMFEVTANKDGKSINVRAVDTCKIDGIVYGHSLIVKPEATNSIDVSTEVY